MPVTLHMVASLDGFIAKSDGDYSWMESAWSSYDKGVEMTTDVLDAIDCYIMGSRTYQLANQLGWLYGDKQAIVITSRKLTSDRRSVDFYSGDLNQLVQRLGQMNVWLVGGPTLSQEFFRLELVDTVCLTVVPILLGDGVPLHRGIEQKLRLTDVSAFKNGMLDLWYDVVRSDAAQES